MEVFWTGGKRSATCSTEWVWSDGTPLNFTGWDSDEPNNINGNEDCINISSDGTWNDMPCAEGLYYICEKPMDKK